MNIAIVGAGAVGSYYGALLGIAGHSVTMVGRAPQVAAMEQHGLILTTAEAVHVVRVIASTDPSAVQSAEVILFCVKSDDTIAAGEETASFCPRNAVILSLQNGVDNAERLEAVLGRPVIAAAVYVAAELTAPGRVKHNGRGELVIGDDPASPLIARMFGDAGIPIEISRNVKGALWTKLIANCAYNALCAIANLPYGRMIEINGVRDVMADVVSECLAVAQALEVELPAGILDSILGLASTMPEQYSSTARDLQRGKRSEIEHLNGYVVRAAERLGIDVPANRLLLVSMRLIEASRLPSATPNANELGKPYR